MQTGDLAMQFLHHVSYAFTLTDINECELEHTHVVTMPTAVTQTVAFTAHVEKVLKETDSTVQV